MDIQFRGIDAARIDSRLRSIKVSGSAKISGNPESQSAMAKLDGAGVQLQFSANQAGGTLTVDRAHLQAGAGTADIKGRLKLKNAQAFDFSGTFSRLDPSKLAAIQPATLNGRISANGKLQPEWQAQVDINLVDSRLRNLPFNAHAASPTGSMVMPNWQSDVTGQKSKADMANRRINSAGPLKPRICAHWIQRLADVLPATAR
jgi:autotransporter translocation and assembly factor TamB